MAALSEVPETPPWRMPADADNNHGWGDGVAWAASHGLAEAEGSADVACGSYWKDDFGAWYGKWEGRADVEYSANDASYVQWQGRADVECSDTPYGTGQGRADVEWFAGAAESQEWPSWSYEGGPAEEAWYRRCEDTPADEDAGRHVASSSAATSRVLEAHGQKRKRYVSCEEQESLKVERAASEELSLCWQARGPYAAEGEEQPLWWRGQKYRWLSGKYANNGGVNKRERALYYKWMANYRRGLRNAEEDERYLPMLEAKKNLVGGPFRSSNA